MPCYHYQKMIKAADGSFPKGGAICRRDRFWKRETAKNAEAGGIVAQSRIPSSELPVMSDVKLTEIWTSFKVQTASPHFYHHPAGLLFIFPEVQAP